MHKSTFLDRPSNIFISKLHNSNINPYNSKYFMKAYNKYEYNLDIFIA